MYLKNKNDLNTRFSLLNLLFINYILKYKTVQIRIIPFFLLGNNSSLCARKYFIVMRVLLSCCIINLKRCPKTFNKGMLRIMS